MSVDEIEGLPGELINRLIELMNDDALGHLAWYNVSMWVQGLIRGSAAGSFPETEEPPAPGTVGDRVRQQTRLVSRAQWFELLRARLAELTASGLLEPFLVRSIRDEIRRMLAHIADIDEVNRKNAETRERIERTLADPVERAAYGAGLAERNPSGTAPSDDEVSAQLNVLLKSKVLLPISPEDALRRQADLDNWDKEVASRLPDEVFSEWNLRSLPHNR